MIRVGDAYYLCQNGVWFTAAGACRTVERRRRRAGSDPIAIPPSSPLHNVTYVPAVSEPAPTRSCTATPTATSASTSPTASSRGEPATTIRPTSAPRRCCSITRARTDLRLRRLPTIPPTASLHRAGYGYGPYGGVAGGDVQCGDRHLRPRRAACTGRISRARPCRAYNPRTGTAAVGESRANPYASWEQGVVYGSVGRAARGEAVLERSRHGRPRADTPTAPTSSPPATASARRRWSAHPAAIGTRGAAAATGTPAATTTFYRRTEQGWERADAARADGSIPGLGRAVGADGYVPSHYCSEPRGRRRPQRGVRRPPAADDELPALPAATGANAASTASAAAATQGVSGGGFHGGGGRRGSGAFRPPNRINAKTRGAERVGEIERSSLRSAVSASSR